MHFTSKEMAYVWAMFYGGIVSLRYHPGNTGPVDLDECALIADEMVIRYCKRAFVIVEVICRGS